MEETVIDPEAEIDPAVFAATLVPNHVADNVEALNQLPPEKAAAVLPHLPRDRAIDILDQPGLNEASDIIRLLPPDLAVTLLTGMAADRAADVFRWIEEPVR